MVSILWCATHLTGVREGRLGQGRNVGIVYLHLWGLLCKYCSCDVCGGGLVCVCVCPYSVLWRIVYVYRTCVHKVSNICCGLPSTFWVGVFPKWLRKDGVFFCSPEATPTSSPPPSPLPGVSSGSEPGRLSFSSLDREDMAVLGWLGDIVHRDITNYSMWVKTFLDIFPYIHTYTI